MNWLHTERQTVPNICLRLQEKAFGNKKKSPGRASRTLCCSVISPCQVLNPPPHRRKARSVPVTNALWSLYIQGNVKKR